MLSPNTLLNKARYRVERLHFGGSKWNVYAAVDQATNATVFVVEHQAQPAPVPTHQGLVCVQESFLMNGRRYDVTEAVNLTQLSASVAKTWDDFSIVLMALNTIASVSSRHYELVPQTVVATANAGYKLLPLESATGPVEFEAWHVPIERIWSDLDHISQKAIYNAWDESSLAGLERPLDESSDLYSIASVFYHIFTGITPPSAFERTVVGLEEADPLVAPQALAPELGEEAGAHLQRCLELRREMRFRSFEDAIMSLPTLALPTRPGEEESEVLDLVSPPRQSMSARSDSVVAQVEVLQPIKYEHDEIREPPAEETKSADAFEPMTVSRPSPEEISSDILPSFTLETGEKRGSGMKFAAAGVVLALVGGLGWGAYQFSQTKPVVTPASVSAEVAAPVGRSEPAAVPSPTPVDDATITATKASTDISADPAQPDSVAKSDGSHPRPQVAAKATPKPASATDPKPKKKVTVDDLINDN
jgi:hypothetical protein